jgi:hypothetical protein
MRNLIDNEAPSLFPTDAALPLSIPVDEPSAEELAAHKLAKEFVKWCFSFGREFHNSPDAGNLRYWVQKYNIPQSGAREGDILSQARRLYLKRIEQAIAT